MSQYAPLLQLSSLDGTDGFRLSGGGTPAGGYVGYSVSDAGDFNHDGYADLLVGGYGPTASTPGAAYLVLGSAAGFGSGFDLSTMTAGQGFKMSGVVNGDAAGWAVRGVGDMNHDGFDDIAVSAINADPGGVNNAGSTYVVFGNAAGTGPASLSGLSGVDGYRIDGLLNSIAGIDLGRAGDVNHDGFADLLVTASGENGGDGAAYVVFGKASGFASVLNVADIDGSNGFRISGLALSAFGRGAALAGDVNGDGFDDLVFGASQDDPNGITDAGGAYVVFGKAGAFAANVDITTLNGTNGFRIAGGEANQLAGLTVRSIGDINGDGFADLEIGAPLAHYDGQAYAGAAFVVFGRGDGFAATVDLATLDGTDGFRIDGLAASSQLGQGAVAVGDLNADGFEDFVVSAVGASGTAGHSYVIFGKANGFAADFDLSTLNGDNGYVIAGSVGEQAGTSASAAGDLNGDGIDDIIIGAPGSLAGGGSAYVVYGALPGEAVDRTGTDIGQVIQGGAFGDVIHGLGGADVLIGHGGDDTLDGGLGNDTIDGGDGVDVASYADAMTGVRVDLTKAGLQNTRGAGVDLLSHIEGLQGSTFADRLTGDANANALSGGGGKDVLVGGGGDDRLDGGQGTDKLTGGLGADVMTGGAGVDRFIFLTLQDSAKGHIDLITDLENKDLIDLRAIDADSTVAGDQHFQLVKKFDHHAGQAMLRFDAAHDRTVLSLDTDGDGKANMMVWITGDHHDFVGFAL